MSKPKQRYWKVTYTMHPPFGEGSCKVWADNAEKAIALAKSHQNPRRSVRSAEGNRDDHTPRYPR